MIEYVPKPVDMKMFGKENAVPAELCATACKIGSVAVLENRFEIYAARSASCVGVYDVEVYPPMPFAMARLMIQPALAALRIAMLNCADAPWQPVHAAYRVPPVADTPVVGL